MNTFETILNGKVAQTLGWTLIHSIWQIALASLLLAALMVVLKDKSARLRYLIATSILAGTFLTSAITFISIWESLPSSTNFSPNQLTQLNYRQLFFESSAQSGSISIWFSTATSYLEQNLTLILSAWIIGVVLLSIRLIGGLSYIFRLRKRKLYSVAEQWTNKLQKLEKSFGLKRKVQLFESALVQIPTVVGYLKPYILVPIGTFTAIPANQIEAILAHELAHIKRNDYLINIFQSILEIIYFFHPGIWWISNMIRKERELCCDDLAVASGCDAISLARALTSVEELFNIKPKNSLAMALNGKGSLLNRIKRLIGHNEQHTSTLNNVSGVAIVLFTAIITFTMNSSDVFSSDKKLKLQNELLNLTTSTPVAKASLTNITSGKLKLDSIKINKDVSIDDRDAVVIIKNDKGEVKEIRVNGKTIPKENWNEKDLQKALKARSFGHIAPPTPPVPPTPPTWGNIELPPVPPVPTIPPMDFVMPDCKFDFEMNDFNENMSPEERKQFEKKMQKFQKDMEEWGKAWEKKYGKEWQERMKKEWEPKMKAYEMSMNEWAKLAEPHLAAMTAHLADLDKMDLPAFNFQFEMNDSFSNGLEQALIADGLIKKGESYQFSISGKNKELIINGKKQSKTLFEKYEKLVKKSSGIDNDDYSFSISK